MDRLNRSKIPRTELIRAKILASDLEKKRYILGELFRGLKSGCFDAVVNWLAQKGDISFDDKLRELENPNFENIGEIIKSNLPGFVPS